MTTRDRLLKTKEFLVIQAYYVGVYFIIAELTRFRTDIHHIAFPFEKNIPLLPALIFAYFMNFCVLAFAYVFVEDLAFFRKMVKAFFIGTTIHFIIFLAFPVEYNLRPVVNPDQGWAYFLVYFYYWMDPPYNCFPSMHVSNCFLVAFLMHRYRSWLSWILHPIAISVAVSVVLVKQHYVVDVVAGFLVAWGVNAWVFRKETVIISTDSRLVREPY